MRPSKRPLAELDRPTVTVTDMDTVHEENDNDSDGSSYSDLGRLRERTQAMQSATTEPLVQTHSQPSGRRLSSDLEAKLAANLNTRRPSAIIAAFRRPSQALALCAAAQRRFLSEHAPHSRASLASTTHDPPSAADILGHSLHGILYHKLCLVWGHVVGVIVWGFCEVLAWVGITVHPFLTVIITTRKLSEAISKALSVLYAKLLVVLGLAFPVTEVIANGVPDGYYKGFYMYLYSVSVLFVIFQYANLMRQKAVNMIIHEHGETDREDKNGKNTPKEKPKSKESISRYGSFYLRLGAIAFGIGSMVYSGLEFGEYFETRDDCRAFLALLTPALRMILTLLQMQFIFLTNKDIECGKYKLVQRFGFMHLIATNLCEWLYVLVEETKHEIHHLEHTMYKRNDTTRTVNETSSISCGRSDMMGTLIQNASPFLFPCTIEYSLICAVILYEMWKEVKCTSEDFERKYVEMRTKNKSRNNSVTPEKILQQFAGMLGVTSQHGSRAALHHFSVDCSHAHRGLFAGILLIVLTIISLIMFFVLAHNPTSVNEAIFEVNICELVLYTLTILATAAAMKQMRVLPYKRKSQAVLTLDTSLLILAQSGMFVYCMFSLIGCHHTLASSDASGLTGFFSEFLSLNQTILQSLFIIDSWWRRCQTSEHRATKPGRQLITFLLVANMAMWAINTLEKNRAEFRPAHLSFYGPWAWTIITHVSMPLAIFYRFHSTICLFEIWKNCFKNKPIYLNI